MSLKLFVMAGNWRSRVENCTSIEGETHISERDGCKIVDVDSSGQQLRLAVRWNKLTNEVRSNGKFCASGQGYRHW